MILADMNQSVVVLQIYAQNPDGTPKLNVVSGSVRVYALVLGNELDVLASTSLVRFLLTSCWRHAWVPGVLPVGEYFVEYTLADSLGATTVVSEDLIVRDIAVQSTLTDVRSRVILLQDDLAIVKKVETGRWKIVANQMVFYDIDEVTPILTFDLKDDVGLPSMERVFERTPV